jgi:hypothetical protein
VHYTTKTFPYDSCHCGDVTLGNFLSNYNASVADILAESFRQGQQHARGGPSAAKSL